MGNEALRGTISVSLEEGGLHSLPPQKVPQKVRRELEVLHHGGAPTPRGGTGREDVGTRPVSAAGQGVPTTRRVTR